MIKSSALSRFSMESGLKVPVAARIAPEQWETLGANLEYWILFKQPFKAYRSLQVPCLARSCLLH